MVTFCKSFSNCEMQPSVEKRIWVYVILAEALPLICYIILDDGFNFGVHACNIGI